MRNRTRDALVAWRQAYALGGARTFALDGSDGTNAAGVAFALARGFAKMGELDSSRAWASRYIAERGARRRLAGDDVFVVLRSDPGFRRLAGLLADPAIGRVAGLRADIALLIEEAQRVYPLAAKTKPSSPFVAAATALQRRLSTLPDSEFPFEIARIVALLGDGHSWLVHPGRLASHPDSMVVPIRFRDFVDGLFVTEAPDSARALVGSKVVQIEGMPVDSFYSRLREVNATDNEASGRYLLLTLRLRVVSQLHTLGLAKAADQLRLRVRHPDGREQDVTVGAVAPAMIAPNPTNGAATAPEDALLSMPWSHMGIPMWVDTAPDHHLVYVRYGQTRSSVQLASTLREAITSVRARVVVLDVRDNLGGFGILTLPLERALLSYLDADPTRRLFVVINGGTYSATQNLVSSLERRGGNVFFVGEPTGLPPNFIGEFNPLTLPYSGAVVSISSAFHQGTLAGFDTRIWIYPSLPAAVSSGDWFAHRDPAMAAILANVSFDR